MALNKVKDFKIQGLMCPPVTPMDDSGEVKYDVIPAYVQHLIDFGILNVFVTGTTGEGLSLSNTERKKVVEAWIEAGKQKLSAIIVHVGTGNLKDSQELARHAEESGASAIACVSPTYHKPQTLDDYISYMQQVSNSAPNLPFYLYDIDFITGLQYSMDEFFAKAKDRIPNLRGLKHTSPSFPSMNTLLVKHPGYEVFLGSNEIFIEALAIGMEVTICDSFLGLVLKRLKDAFDRGDIKTARIEQNKALAVCDIKRKYGLSIPAGAKVLLRAIGLEVGSPRLPLSSVPDDVVKSVKEDLKHIGFFDWGIAK